MTLQITDSKGVILHSAVLYNSKTGRVVDNLAIQENAKLDLDKLVTVVGGE